MTQIEYALVGRVTPEIEAVARLGQGESVRAALPTIVRIAEESQAVIKSWLAAHVI